MSNMEMLAELLRQTLDAVERIIKRFEPVDSADFFTDTAGGMEKLDAICMLLIAVGESLKKSNCSVAPHLCPFRTSRIPKYASKS